MIKIYNSLTQQKEEFKPIEEGKVKLYVCGLTVYDYPHIGHARSYIMFDVIARYFRACGYELTYVRNVTDIEDKIIKRAQENDESWQELTQRFFDVFKDNEKALGMLPPDHEPRATEYIQPIIDLIQTLLDKGAAYVADNGDVYFSVREFKDYGKLSKRDLDKLIVGARVDLNDAKREPLDFVLWKMSKPNEPKWESPWGEGRPGWHIECSAMSTGMLGQPFDIHGGGMDLKFPHHENEIAQSEAACSKQFANYWMHIGLLQINKEKMSKSLNNFVTIQEALEENDAEVLRYFMISGHYRSPVSYSKDNLKQMRRSLESLYLAVRGLPVVEEDTATTYKDRFHAAMDDDFNTPEALAAVFECAHEINLLRDAGDTDAAAKLAVGLRKMTDVLGILQQDPEAFLRGDASDDLADKVEALIAARNQARADKQWQEADRLRDEITALGVVIEDGASGTTWRVA